MKINSKSEYKLVSVEFSDGTRLNSDDYVDLTAKGKDDRQGELYAISTDENNLNALDTYLSLWTRIVYNNQPCKKEQATQDITFTYEKIDNPDKKIVETYRNAFPSIISEHDTDENINDLSITFNYDFLDTTFS